MSATCPWCDAPRNAGLKCHQCKAIYAKAEALKAGGAVAVATDSYTADIDGLWSETTLRAAAIPAALALALWFHATSLGHFLQRTFLTMMVHEVGHALSAWWCGFAAFPFLWRTWIAENRGLITPLAVFAASSFLVAWSIRSGKRAGVAGGAALFLLQIGGTAILSRQSAQALITFGGDGGALVLGTLLMCTFFFGRETQLYKGALRWGFLVIGAAAFVDTFATWWQARTDVDAIPFGEIEGVGLSDPSKLTEVYGWTTRAMVHRYVALGVVCLLVLGAVWSWGVWSSRRSDVQARSDEKS